MTLLLNSLVVVFSFIFLGWLGARFGIFKINESRTLNNLVYYFTFPALLFSNLRKTDWQIIANRNFIIINTAIVALGFLVAYLWGHWRKYPAKKRILVATAVVLGNTAYLGIPLNEQLLGQTGLIFASLIASWQVLLLLIISLYLLQRQEKSHPSFLATVGNTIKTPLILAVILGLVFAFFRFPVPATLDKIISMVGQTTTVIALIALGIFLRDIKWREQISTSIGLAIATLLILPAVALLFTNILPLDNTIRAITILQIAAPVAALNFTIAQKFQTEEKLIAGAILVSTVLSFFTYGFWILILL